MMTAAPVAAAPATTTNPAPILVVRPTVSASNPAEKSYAQAIAKNLSRRLRETGIPHDTIEEDKLDASAVRNRTVLVLPYNPCPPPVEIGVLSKHVASGGKLLVFYSASEPLAQLMKLKLGAPNAFPTRDRWCAMRFNSLAPQGTPPVVRQYSRSMRAVEPVTADAKVIAFWEDVAGKPTRDAAWLKTPNGYWMTHIVLDDGDNDAKNRMLLAVLGDMAPTLWPGAARHRLAEAVSIGSCDNLAAAIAAARESAVDDIAKAKVDTRIAEANRLYSTITNFLQNGDYPAASAGCPELRHTVLSAYAAAQKPALDRRRGVWDRHGLGLYPGDWDRTCATLVSHGINALFVNLLTAGSAHYASRVLAPSETFDVYGDQLKAASEAARKYGLEFHVWAICWGLQGAPQEKVNRLSRDGRMQTNDKGESTNWLCPTHPENIALEKDAIRELMRLTPVTGVHLDYIRFHDSRSCACAGCRARFEKQKGKRVKNWPSDALSGSMQDDFRAWRTDQISRLVEDMSAIVRTGQSNAVLSAAVYGRYSSAVTSVAQDWKKWTHKGWLDFICPMDYTTDRDKFEEYVKEQIRLVGAQRVFPGIGVTAAESRLDAAQVTDQVVGARRLGVSGFVLFDLNRILVDDVLPYLPMGPKAPIGVER
jgi:uncharacterized lipoprotein YddW (UPF0748 family)